MAIENRDAPEQFRNNTRQTPNGLDDARTYILKKLDRISGQIHHSTPILLSLSLVEIATNATPQKSQNSLKAPASSDFDGSFVRDCIREVCLAPSTNPTFDCKFKSIAPILRRRVFRRCATASTGHFCPLPER